jgi:hypothetical protein
MSIAAQAEAKPDVVAEDDDHAYEFTAAQFLGMIEAGVFPREARVYLRDGRIHQKMAKTQAHSIAANMMHEALFGRLPRGWRVFAEGEFKIAEAHVALPGLAAVRAESFRSLLEPGKFPQGRDIGLAVEVSVTSLAKDLGSNLRRYAKAMIPTYWVADFKGRRLLSHTKPRIVEGRGEYESVQVVAPGDSFGLALDGIEVARFAYEDLMP